MPFEAKAVANLFLDLAAGDQMTLTPMKIQKLVYFAHGWHLALTGSDLLDEQVEAWDYGPVIPTLYRAFRQYGNQPIADKAAEWKPKQGGGARLVEPTIPDDTPDGAYARSVIGRVWAIYGPYTGIQLSNMTHEPGTPWTTTVADYAGKPPKGTDIPRQTILDWFRGRLARKATT